MATANPNPITARRSRRWLRRLVWALAFAGLAALALYWKPLRGATLTGASYGARIACSCRYIAGRPLSDCRKDFEPGMGLLILSENVEAKSITARYPLLASQTATFHEGAGCMLEPWEG